jgi:phosphoglucosamine mutase
MLRTGKSLAELSEGFVKFPQTMINVPIAAGAAKRMEGSARIQQAVRDIETTFNGKGRVILRPSGTEPLIRVTLEGSDAVMVQTLAQQLADTVREELQV